MRRRALQSLRAQSRALRSLALCAIVVIATGCTWFGRDDNEGDAGPKCRDPALPEQVENRAPLRVEAGLDAPDTRGAIVIPPAPERASEAAANPNCLSPPPSYSNAGA